MGTVTDSARPLYNTGARVSEITGLQRTDVKFGIKSFVQFTGKGRKEGAVPLWPKTAQLLRDLFKELESDRRNEAVAFPNARGKALLADMVRTICFKNAWSAPL